MNDSTNGSSYQQLELPINIPPPLPKKPTNYDSSWDKPDTSVPPYAPGCVREQVDFDTKSDNIESERDELPETEACPSPQPSQDFHHLIQPSEKGVAPEHDQSVREQHLCKSAPEHKQLGIQWVEEYWVKRSGKQHYYYRFCWMDGRKIRHKHIGGGNVNSPTATYRKLIVEASLDTATSGEIVDLINSFKHTKT